MAYAAPHRPLPSLGWIGRRQRTRLRKTLHIVPGLTAGGRVRAAMKSRGSNAPVVALFDLFEAGHVPTLDDPVAFVLARAEDMARSYDDDSFITRAEEDIRLLLRSGEAATRIELWAGGTLQEQLALAFTIALTAQQGWAEKLALHQMLPPGDLPGLPLLSKEVYAATPEAAPLSPQLLRLYQALWDGFTAPSPEQLLTLRRSPALPSIMAAALDSHFARFPHAATGLGTREERLIAAISAHPGPLSRAIAQALGDTRPPLVDACGDLTFLETVNRLARLPEKAPVLTLGESGKTPMSRNVQLTPYGEALAAGGASLLADGGVDDWIGGTRVRSGDAPMWVRTGGAGFLHLSNL
ncbi:DUF1835 domain-containing protein [Vannielia sp.]|uniref:DUF1835 domain-containing protein n=1 Tax=Vannielia sp. TaxID=2813045 RepID=UPI00261346E4|nr:DUF1835 domain-containing protein [Vannielia sp.]MDF1871844.1 DUF1835 domain-containing protein [Vannielia sp.]